MSLTIVIPFYNRKEFIEEKYIQFLEYSDDEEIEIIFVNDGSNEELTFLVTHKNIRVINLRRNFGVQRARNIGLSEASKEFIIFFDSDDILNLEVLRSNLNLLRSNIGYCVPRIIDAHGIMRKSRFTFIPKYSMSPVPTSFLVFNRMFLLERGIKFDEALKSCQDDDIYLTCKNICNPVKYRFSWGCFYNHNEDRITTGKNYRAGRNALLEKHNELGKSLLTKVETRIYFGK
ncbi:glycosyltransferase [Alphaproteobacteria bacterium]|nr:glycosyltransferase [Alphaproteobacteria bacterium]MDB2406723.1 glycosyltransferase [Alphaproteobacteria bacterium]MDB2540621.1 glycosyltransferase [Alphaproteobacteria bacterium]MDB2649020.1 glycosyltransferase [Alphaproteobacteria bacterium]